MSYDPRYLMTLAYNPNAVTELQNTRFELQEINQQLFGLEQLQKQLTIKVSVLERESKKAVNWMKAKKMYAFGFRVEGYVRYYYSQHLHLPGTFSLTILIQEGFEEFVSTMFKLEGEGIPAFFSPNGEFPRITDVGNDTQDPYIWLCLTSLISPERRNEFDIIDVLTFLEKITADPTVELS